jgi:hypothetical protein
MVNDFTLLLDWLHIAATIDGAATIEQSSGPSTIPIMDTCLQTQLVQLFKQDLPGCWGTQAPGIDLGPVQCLSTNLEELLAQYLLDQHPVGPHMDVAGRERLPSEMWMKGTILDLLLQLTYKSPQKRTCCPCGMLGPTARRMSSELSYKNTCGRWPETQISQSP